MMRVTISSVALMGLAVASFAMAQSPASVPVPAGLQVGDKAPGFSLVGSDGKTYSLAEFKSKKAVVLAWFPKAFTGGWTAECKSLRESGDDIRSFDVAYFSASVDTPQDNRRFAESLELDYPILSDPGKHVALAYGVVTPERPLAQRWTFYIGVDGTITAIDKKISVATAGKDLAAKLTELGVAKKK